MRVTAALTIMLSADGNLTYKADVLLISTHDSTGQPRSCEIIPKGYSETLSGTYKDDGSFSVPSGSSIVPPITGNYDETHITAKRLWSWTGGQQTMDFDLPSTNHRIAIKPTPSTGFDFHKSILEGKGFTIEVHDPDGRDHLDWNTFQIFVGGNDTTQLFWDKTINGVVPMKDESIDSLNKVFRLIPDPKKLMTESDIFAIPWNGNWLIELKICDKSGFCFQSKDNVYFGPFFAFSKAIDLRCYDTKNATMAVFNIMYGNTGIDSPKTSFVLALLNAAPPNDFWTLYHSYYEGLTFWLQNQLMPAWAGLDIWSGYYAPPLAQLIFPVSETLPDTGKGIPAGDYYLITAVLDTVTGVWGMDWHDIKMCNP